MAQISPKLFSKDLAVEIFPANVFYTKGFKDIAAGDVTSVDIPIAGNIGTAKKGHPTLPLTIKQRSDSVLNYALTQLYCDPVFVPREEDIVLNYSKQLDLTRAMGESISSLAADLTANIWGVTGSTTSGRVVMTTGTARATDLVGASGNRKAITKADFLNVRKAFMKQNIPLNGIIAVVTPQQYTDILGIAEFVDFEKTGVMTKLAEGVVGRILGFDIMVRWNETLGSIGLHYDATGANKKDLASVDATDAPAALFFHPRYVRYAEAFPETIINRKPAGYLGGTIIEAVVRYGASHSRTDQRGVVVLVEAT